jgi:hypothetical protein
MEKGIDLQPFGDEALRARSKGSLSESKGQEIDQDRIDLAKVGKQQVLKVCDSLPGPTCSLTVVAAVWIGEHDRAVVWSNVHLGKSACVST